MELFHSVEVTGRFEIDPKQVERTDQWLRSCRGQIEPSDRTFADMIAYFLEQYDAEECTQSPDGQSYKERLREEGQRLDDGISIYSVPLTPKNRPLFERCRQERPQWAGMELEKLAKRPCLILFDPSAEELCSSGVGGSQILADLILFKGVSQEDLDNMTPHFHAYVRTRVQYGTLISFESFCAGL